MSLTETQKIIKKQVHDYCKDTFKRLTEKILRLIIEIIELHLLLNNTRYMIHILLLRLFIAIHDIFQHRYIQYIH